jgi:prephenate dehydrogenase
MANLLIFGVGLIGGSIALKCKEKNLFNVVGVARKGGTAISPLVNKGIIDQVSTNLAFDVEKADIIIIATPVAQTSSIFQQIYPLLSSKTIITDVGSTKLEIIAHARKHLKEKFTHFIGSHPIAGSEKHGAAAAQKNLFVNKNIILTKESDTNSKAIEILTNFWKSLGGIISLMTAQEHDEIFSTVSHLPHLLAFSLVNLINKKTNKDILLNFAASGFRDFSRIAASSPEMWRDISMANKKAILEDLQLFQNQIKRLSKMIEDNDQSELEKYLQAASSTRKNWTDL